MNTQSTTRYGILVAVDGSSESDAAVRWAAQEAVLRDTPVTIMHVIQPVAVSWPIGTLQVSYSDWQQQNARDVIEQAVRTSWASVGESASLDVRTDVMCSAVVPALVSASKEADMLVVGSRGRGALGRVFLGSVSSGVLHHAYGRIAVVHEHEAQAPGSTARVLVGIDGTPASEAATALAFDEASRRGVELVALHAWSDVGVFPLLGMDWREHEDEGHEVLAERLAGWQERYPDVTVRRRIVCDRPARWLIDESRQAQLVVVGSHGRGGYPGMLLGSVGSAVAREAKAPVIVVRSL